MSAYLMALFMDDEPATHGWIITEDVFAKANNEPQDSLGDMGPRQSTDDVKEELQRRFEGKAAREGFSSAMFNMYVDVDNDKQVRGERMVRGRLVWTSDQTPGEDVLISPLSDYGAPSFGCVRIEYDGHPKWTIG